jgi:hypothetical protein
MAEGKCEVCGTPLTGQRSSKKYCTVKCRQAKTRARQRDPDHVIDQLLAKGFGQALRAKHREAPKEDHEAFTRELLGAEQRWRKDLERLKTFFEEAAQRRQKEEEARQRREAEERRERERVQRLRSKSWEALTDEEKKEVNGKRFAEEWEARVRAGDPSTGRHGIHGHHAPTLAYQTLGLKVGATMAEVRSVQRRLARELHPDLGRQDSQAELRIRQVNAAVEVLRKHIEQVN